MPLKNRYNKKLLDSIMEKLNIFIGPLLGRAPFLHFRINLRKALCNIVVVYFNPVRDGTLSTLYD